MTTLTETIFSSHEERERLAWEKLFPDPLTAHAGDYIVNLLGDGSMDEFQLDANFRVHVAFIAEATGSPGVGIARTSKAVADAIATLLDNHLIEKWEYQEDDGTMVDYYDLPEEEDND